VSDPYDREGGSPVAKDKALTDVRGLPGFNEMTVNPDREFYRGDRDDEEEEEEEEGGGEGASVPEVRDAQVEEQTVRTLSTTEARILLTAQKDDAQYVGPTMYALVNPATGAVIPLDKQDERRLAALQVLPARVGEVAPALWADPSARAALILRATLGRRALRASYTDDGLKRIAAGMLLMVSHSAPHCAGLVTTMYNTQCDTPLTPTLPPAAW
jgi:hypothetical protein